MDKVSAFWVGNVIGLIILVGGIILTAPQKMKESSAQQKEAQAASQNKVDTPTSDAPASDQAKETAAAVVVAGPVVVALKAIHHGQKISKVDVVLQEQSPTDSQSMTSESIADISNVLDHVAKSDIAAGSIVTKAAIDQ